MLADMAAMAADMSAIALSRWSAAWKTRLKESHSQGVQIVEPYDGQGKSRVDWGCVVVLCGGMPCGGIVVVVLSSSMVAVCSGIIIVVGVVIMALLSSMMGIIGVGIVVVKVGSSLGQGDVLPVVGGMQHAGGSLHDGETT